MNRSLRLSLLLLAIVPLAAFAQPSKPVAPNKTDGGRVDITNALDGTMIYNKAQGLARLTKDVVITQRGQNLIVYAQEAIYSRERNQATATGRLRVVTRDSTTRGLNLRADFDERQCIISGNVVITSHGKNDGAMAGLRGEDTKKPIRVQCDQVVWEYDTKQAIATGNIRIFQDNNRGTCDKIIYDEMKNIVRLMGHVRFGDNEDSRFSAQELDFYVDDDVATTPHGILSFHEQVGMNAQRGNANAKTPRPSKTPAAFKPAPTLPPDVLERFNAPPIASPATSEEPVAALMPDETTEEAPANGTP